MSAQVRVASIARLLVGLPRSLFKIRDPVSVRVPVRVASSTIALVPSSAVPALASAVAVLASRSVQVRPTLDAELASALTLVFTEALTLASGALLLVLEELLALRARRSDIGSAPVWGDFAQEMLTALKRPSILTAMLRCASVLVSEVVLEVLKGVWRAWRMVVVVAARPHASYAIEKGLRRRRLRLFKGDVERPRESVQTFLPRSTYFLPTRTVATALDQQFGLQRTASWCVEVVGPYKMHS